MARNTSAIHSLGMLYRDVIKARVLLVGAGGIGCELLKNLVLTGFGEVVIVDLDTIDLSNLNRQFLFRREHIKQSKALVAKETASKFNPNVKLEAHHANIKDPQFTIDWFQSFKIVFNALDNLDARRHVNKMCLAADVPLIESGTTGFNGQVQVIKRVCRRMHLRKRARVADVNRQGETECYDCNAKQAPKSFPVCTIRTTPSQPIHSIVWAKSYLFTELFGTSEDDAPELDHSDDAKNAGEIENLQRESQALRRIREARGSEEFPRKVFQKVYGEDIKRLRGMEDLWKTRRPPTVLDYDQVAAQAASVNNPVDASDQVTWNTAENFAVFVDSLGRLSKRIQDAQAKAAPGDPPCILSFDKDDVDALDFVSASSNLRSIVFGIEPKSKFDIKQMAGNIIPAIATTNAMVAGLCVLQAFKVMNRELDSARNVFLTKSVDRVISAEKLCKPRPDCPTCSVVQTRVKVDTSRATLQDLVEGLLRLELGYGEEFSVNNEVGTLYDPDLEDNLSKKFKDLGINNDSFLTIIDEAEENPRVNLVLSVSETYFPPDSKPIFIPTKVEIGRRPKMATPAPNTNGANGSTNTNGVNPTAIIGKRKREEDPEDEQRHDKMIRGFVPEEKTTMATNGAGAGVTTTSKNVVVLDGDTTAGNNVVVIDGDEVGDNGVLNFDDID
ncbi:MAG: hypothetical protein M1823_005559 [Watsoniomyces obsoletus]|nr:MAG: hypothetical protein M1823_005559 [Watsoniomyces obsoletus]